MVLLDLEVMTVVRVEPRAVGGGEAGATRRAVEGLILRLRWTIWLIRRGGTAMTSPGGVDLAWGQEVLEEDPPGWIRVRAAIMKLLGPW